MNDLLTSLATNLDNHMWTNLYNVAGHSLYKCSNVVGKHNLSSTYIMNENIAQHHGTVCNGGYQSENGRIFEL